MSTVRDAHSIEARNRPFLPDLLTSSPTPVEKQKIMATKLLCNEKTPPSCCGFTPAPSCFEEEDFSESEKVRQFCQFSCRSICYESNQRYVILRELSSHGCSLKGYLKDCGIPPAHNLAVILARRAFSFPSRGGFSPTVFELEPL